MKTISLKICGIVQGVGFRPFVANLARAHGIRGTVANRGSYVEIFAAGTAEDLRIFQGELLEKAPERSSILSIHVTEVKGAKHFTGFSIIESEQDTGAVFVSPDIAICENCQKELFTPSNRRYLHPFINCTACGPRLTILDAMPYDRERTSMKNFPMCGKCAVEYHDPGDRRYDAQPVCCNDCGPEYFILDRSNIRNDRAIEKVRRVLADGGIAAIKGIGGFHLACDARNSAAVMKLRKRKHRPRKPFAVMLRDMDEVRKELLTTSAMESVMQGSQKPILLLKKRMSSSLSPVVAPGNPKIGAMLPYAPIQMLLFDYPDGIDAPSALIMTSGNPTGAPICHTDAEAEQALAKIADIILTNNRPIRLRADDSVMDFFENRPYMIRRSRGYAPLPIILSENKEKKGDILAVGGELKNTFTIAKDNLLYPSPYIGDMTDLRTADALKDAVRDMKTLLEASPKLVVTDMHPRYNTKRVAESFGIPVVCVQHHYAHILSCMAENKHLAPVIGIAFDGTGYGTDGTIWGGEILRVSLKGFTRLGSIEPFPQAGGDKSSVDGWRIALGILYTLYGEEGARKIADQFNLASETERTAVFFMVKNHINCVTSTSAGRLFDAVSALLGIRKCSSFEGEAAMDLEFSAEAFECRLKSKMPLPSGEDILDLAIETAKDGRFLLPTNHLLERVIKERKIPAQEGAYRFHARLAQCIARGAEIAHRKTKLSTVALSGGVFQNTLLLRLTKNLLEQANFNVLIHSEIPPNDGGISLGQALAAMYQM